LQYETAEIGSLD